MKQIPFWIRSSLSIALVAVGLGLLTGCAHKDPVAPITAGTSSPTAVATAAQLASREKAFSGGKQLGLAIMEYTIAHGNAFPAGTDSQSILGKVKVAGVDVGAFEFNPALAGISVQSLPPAKVATTVVCYETQPEYDGTRCVVFADAHCQMVSPDAWSTLKGHLGP